MTDMTPFGSPAALALLGFQPEQRPMLQSIVETGRTVFAAQACSVFLAAPDQLGVTFEAVAGHGQQHLVGTTIPAGRGVVGWVAATGEPLVVDDVAGSPLFDRAFAESTGFLPRSIIAAPLLIDGETIGVIEVLDRTCGHRGTLSDLELLNMLALQAATAVQLVRRARAADVVGADDLRFRDITRLLTLLDELEPDRLAAVRELLRILTRLCT